ncbi:MAG: hypothetical protein MI921_16635 [Cytophagales bacterium]|nr:hypothetical protein [Cytophagales bacterium]
MTGNWNFLPKTIGYGALVILGMLSSCGEDETLDGQALSTGKMIMVPMNIGTTSVEVTGRIHRTNSLKNVFTFILVREIDNEDRLDFYEVEDYYAAGVFEGVPTGQNLEMKQGHEYEITVKVLAASETSHGLLVTDDGPGRKTVVPHHPWEPELQEKNYNVVVTNKIHYEASALKAVNLAERQTWRTGFAIYIDGDGSIQEGEHMPELDAYYKQLDFIASQDAEINVDLRHHAFALRLETNGSITASYRAKLGYPEREGYTRDYLNIHPQKTSDRKVATFYSVGTIGAVYALIVEKNDGNGWEEIYRDSQNFYLLKERAIIIGESDNPSNKGNPNISFDTREITEGEPIEIPAD